MFLNLLNSKKTTTTLQKQGRFVLLGLCCLLLFAVVGAAPVFAKGVGDSGKDGDFSVLVYITGVRAGSPSYEMLADGAQEFAVANPRVKVTVYEAGFNQAEWEEQLMSLVAGGKFDLVLGSNPSLPEVCAKVGKNFPNQKFIITDAYYEGNPQISAWLYNQYEQAFFLGYLAGLVATSNMPHVVAVRRNGAPKIGFIAAQEYPLLNKHIVPGFIEGARRVDPRIELDFRVIGNWFDANKAANLASSMIDAQVGVFTSIAGGAVQGLIRTIQSRGAYAVFFNTSEYNQAPGYIVGCGSMEQKKLVKEILADVLAGKIQYGKSRIVGTKEGYLNFIDDPGYRDVLPADIRTKFDAFMNDLRTGRIAYTVPPL